MIFETEDVTEIKKKALTQGGLNEEEWEKILAYVAGVFTNCGNFFSYGDNKFIPEVSKEKMWGWIKSTKLYETKPQLLNELF